MNNAYRGVRVYINKCNGSDCYNDSVIETKLHNAKFIVNYLSFSSNIFNINSNDIKYQLITTSSTITTGILKKVFFTFDKGKFDLYNSIIFKNKLSFNYIIANGYSIDVDLDPKSTMKRSDNTISYLSFHYSGNVVETKKEVQNIFSTLSIIGNIINIVLTIFKVINNYYSNKILFVDIFKNIFFVKEYMNINLNNYIHFNNNFKTKYNYKNKNNLDISDEIGFNNCINRNKNIKPSSKKKMILFSDKNILTKTKSKLFSENEGAINKKYKLIFFYLFPLCYLRKNKAFNNVYFIKDKICGYFSIEKINELIKFKETIDEKVHKTKMNNTELIFVHNNNLENNSLKLKNNSNSNK
jgi:hypothetical protein